MGRFNQLNTNMMLWCSVSNLKHFGLKAYVIYFEFKHWS